MLWKWSIDVAAFHQTYSAIEAAQVVRGYWDKLGQKAMRWHATGVLRRLA